jgi:hypothetical protein
MKIKIDEQTKTAVLKDGLPVYVYDDGTEGPFDAKATLENLNRRISNLSEEKDRFFGKAKDYEEKFKAYEGIDPAKYGEYEKVVKNLNDKALLDEKGIEALKKTMRETFEEEKKAEAKRYETMVNERETQVQSLNGLVYDLVIKNKFATSDFFAGDKPKTIYQPEDAALIFGRNFEVQIKDNKVDLVAKDEKGAVIMSKKNHGEPADFDEAITTLVEARAKKYSILRNHSPGGPPIHGNLDTGGKSIDELTPQERIRVGLNQRFKGHFGAPK